MSRPFDFVFLGLTISSSWGNGHATTYRSLLRGLEREGKRVLFLERDVPWYADNRDLPQPDFCTLRFYRDLDEIGAYLPEMAAADAVIVGSYVPEGAALIDRLAEDPPTLLCFYDIDTPVTLACLQDGAEDYVTRRQLALFDLYFSFAGGRVLDRLERRFGVRRAVPLYCSVDPQRHFKTGDAVAWDLGYLGTYSEDRQPVLEKFLLQPARMLPDRRFAVAGSGYPEDIDWPDNVERLGHLAPADHAAFYSAQAFTLNVTRADMAASGWSPSVRLFEAGACETAVISDRWEGLSEILPEVLIADTSADVVNILRHLPRLRRSALARAMRDHVLERHSGEARARELLWQIENCRRQDGQFQTSVAV